MERKQPGENNPEGTNVPENKLGTPPTKYIEGYEAASQYSGFSAQRLRRLVMWRETTDALHRLRGMGAASDQQHVFVNRHSQPLTREGVNSGSLT